jgi:hypothetical protein
MKNTLLFIIVCAILSTTLLIFASGITYNNDGSITQIDSNGNKIIINMDGKTPEGIIIPDETKKIKIKNTELEIVYSGAMSDMPLSFYKNEGYIKKFLNSLINKSSVKLTENNINEKNIKIVISNCRIGKTGLCGRTHRTDVKLTVYKESLLIDEIVLNHGDILGKNNYSVAAKVCVDRIFSKL